MSISDASSGTEGVTFTESKATVIGEELLSLNPLTLIFLGITVASTCVTFCPLFDFTVNSTSSFPEPFLETV